jgi:hypothetical protein
MTIRTTISKVGPVEVVRVDAELLPTPSQYVCDCTECGWGYFQTKDQTTAEMEAQAHLDRSHKLFDEFDDVVDGDDLND